MSERLFRRRELGPLALGALASVVGAFADVDHYHDLASEDRYHRFINEQAARCAEQCGKLELPYSLGFDVSQRPYGLVIPGLGKAGYPLVADGRYPVFVPMWANGEPEPLKPQPLKIERPDWSEMFYTPIFKGPSNKRRVALTIDDGGEAREEILKTIMEKKVEVTLLIIGDIMESDSDFIRRADESGLVTWGNHTRTHRLNFASATKEQIQSEMNSAEASLQRIVHKTTKPIGRPPGGTRSAQGIQALAELGIGTMLWNVSGDAGTQWSSDNPWALAKWYLDQLIAMKNPWGSIILLHFRKSTGTFTINGRPSEKGPSALSLIIDGIRDLDMEPTSVDRLFSVAA